MQLLRFVPNNERTKNTVYQDCVFQGGCQIRLILDIGHE